MNAFVRSSLQRLVQAASPRKHKELIRECKAVLEELEKIQTEFTEQLVTDESAGSATPTTDAPAAQALRDSSGPPCVPRDIAGDVVCKPLLLACETNSVKLQDIALACLQRLIERGFLKGKAGTKDGVPLLDGVVDSVCKCSESDESLELAVIKTLLTAVTSTELQVHGECLLQAVRTCYNVYLASKNEIHQSTAKASLTQMCNVVFQRMEATSPEAGPLTAADLVEPAEVSPSVSQYVQGYVTRVLDDIEGAFATSAPPPSPGTRMDAVFVSALDHDEEDELHDLADIGDDVHMEGISEAEQEEKDWQVVSTPVTEVLEGRTASCDTADEDTKTGRRLSQEQRDAYLVFRSLCKLSMKQLPQGPSEQYSLRGKVLALELLKILLDNCGPVFRTSEKFIGAIKQYLCLSLLKNCASAVQNVFQLSCSIFVTLITKFRMSLKAEIGVFFPTILLRLLETVGAATFQQKSIVIRSLQRLCDDEQVLVDLFVNYDCDLDSSNLFERLVNGLLKAVHGVPESGLTAAQEQALRVDAMNCLSKCLTSLKRWIYKDQNPVHVSTRIPSSDDLRGDDNGESSEATMVDQAKKYKSEFEEGVALFNKKPKKGLNFLISKGMLEEDPVRIAEFLKTSPGLDKTTIGDYIGEREELALKVMHAYVDSLDFAGMVFDDAIRHFLLGFRLPGEAQKIDRLMEKFAERFCKCNPSVFKTADTAYVLGYSVIMLNTDAHNPMVKNKMKKEEFLRNNRGIDAEGRDLPQEVLEGIYDRITQNEIKMKDGGLPGDGAAKTPLKAGALSSMSMDSLMSLIPTRRRVSHIDTSEEAIRDTQQAVKEQGSRVSAFQSAVEIASVKPMLDVVWPPMLAAFTVPLEQSHDPDLIQLCLTGMSDVVHIACRMGMDTLRDAFMSAIVNFTNLNQGSEISEKNELAIKVMFAIAETDGNYMQDNWTQILKCVSRLDSLSLASNAVSDATLFAVKEISEQKDSGRFRRFTMGLSRSLDGLRNTSKPATEGPLPPPQVSEDSFVVLSRFEIEEQTSRLFFNSASLDSQAIVEFVKCLCDVSLEELRSPKAPRVFSLQKIVEISAFNMNRVRIVWSRIWNKLGDYFIQVGCHGSLPVAMYAIDSLRQLAMKFLERDELANFSFQNDFLKPFVIVMRRSKSLEIRELIVRCVSQMILARVTNIKSGWKSMFMVFTCAATDENHAIVKLTFETIEKIVREYFQHITETDTSTFTDCVNCLIAFTNSPLNSDVSLNAIAFLRFCALKLAEGSIGELSEGNDGQEGDQENGAKPKPKKQEIVETSSTQLFTDSELHVYFWFPLLAGLSELTFDARPEIRKSSLEVLFDILRFHGHLFTTSFWDCVFDSVLFRIFDHVRSESLHDGRPLKGKDIDAWLYDTCTHCLQLVVDLIIKFYTALRPELVGRFLALLVSFIQRPHESLASMGVAALVRFLANGAPMLTEKGWLDVLGYVDEAVVATLPNLRIIVAEEPDAQGEDEAASESGGTVAPEDAAEDSEKSPGLDVEGAEAGDDENEQMDRHDEIEKVSIQQRIQEAQISMSIQLLLVQAVSEFYGQHCSLMTSKRLETLLSILSKIIDHATHINRNTRMRAELASKGAMPPLEDPPLLRLEVEGMQVYLAVLQDTCNAEWPSGENAQWLDSVEQRMFQLCREIIVSYVLSQQENADGKMDSVQRRELAARTPLLVSVLKTMQALDESLFRKHVKDFYPLLSDMIKSEVTLPEVQLALSNLFGSKIGPLLVGKA
mmetsp:Transcript_7972/g.29482  ORF Transcript_7972/g.29482 Transcript_7972/m.29482 type:complete len:1752 (-) Transcript_7972:83-5338(-)